MVILDTIGQKRNDLCHCGPLMIPVSHQFSVMASAPGPENFAHRSCDRANERAEHVIVCKDS